MSIGSVVVTLNFRCAIRYISGVSCRLHFGGNDVSGEIVCRERHHLPHGWDVVVTSPVLVGIGGGTGSGKSTLARLVSEHYGRARVAVIDQDAYYLARGHLTLDERRAVNYDEPGAVDHVALARDLARLRRGVPVDKPRYSFATHSREPLADRVLPVPLVIVEGLFALSDGVVRSLLALKVFVDADAEIRFIRRLRRDIAERGRSMDEIVAQYLGSVRPMHRLHVEPTRRFADLVVSGEQIETSLPAIVRDVDRLLAGAAANPSRALVRPTA